MLEQLTMITEQLENQRLHENGIGAPLSQENVLLISSRNDSENVLHKYLQDDCSDSTTIRAPSMQVSTFRASTISTRYTFISAAERLIFSSRDSTMAISMQIFVLGLPNQRTLVVSVYLDDTMEYIQNGIRDRIGIPSINFSLCHIGKCVPSGTTVRESGIKPLSTLTCVGLTTGVRRSCSLNFGKIYVKTWAGVSFVTDLKPDTIKVEDLKAQIETREGIPYDQQQLTFAGRTLEDHVKLAECGIFHGSTIQLVVLPRLSEARAIKRHPSALPFRATEPKPLRKPPLLPGQRKVTKVFRSLFSGRRQARDVIVEE